MVAIKADDDCVICRFEECEYSILCNILKRTLAGMLNKAQKALYKQLKEWGKKFDKK